MEITLRDEFIKLGQALKLAGVVEDGVEAKFVIQDGLVKKRRGGRYLLGRKLYEGDVIYFDGKMRSK